MQNIKKSIPFLLCWKRNAFFTLFLFASSCSNDLQEVKELSGDFFNIEYGKNVEIQYTENGLPTIKITAPSAKRYNAKAPEIPYTEFPDGMKLIVFDKEGKQESELTDR
ncbi:MAG: hypothetical protein LRY27_03905 [Chitinophagales bacterium]|nr:hypothetical protein [Chitinophagales bacterium]